MRCIAENCEREAMYKKVSLCQKHYFRVMRTGTHEAIKKTRKDRIVTPNGYARIYKPDHALADRRGYVFEHRAVMWEKAGGICKKCDACEKPESWATCHVDHIDNDRLNNSPSNLRILCRGCNIKRGLRPESYAARGAGLITFDGKTDTCHGWARDPRVSLVSQSIARRKRAGMSDYDCLFAPKKTHNGKVKPSAIKSETQEGES